MSEAKPHSAIHASNFVPDNGGSAPDGAPNGKDKKKVRNKTPKSCLYWLYLYSFLGWVAWNVEGLLLESYIFAIIWCINVWHHLSNNTYNE